MYIFHVTTGERWSDAAISGQYEWSTRYSHLRDVGFIHAVWKNQIDRVLDTYFVADDASTPIIALTIDTRQLTSPWHVADIGSGSYPHIDGPLNTSAVVEATALVPTDISWEIPWLLPTNLTTERLRMRAAEEADRDVWHRLLTDPEVRRFLGGPIDDNVAAIRRARESLRDIIAIEDAHDVVGMCAVTPHGAALELSLQFLPEQWGQGLAAEAGARLLDWVWSTSPLVQRAEIVTHPGNERSARLAGALAMTPRGQVVERGVEHTVFAVERPLSPGLSTNPG